MKLHAVFGIAASNFANKYLFQSRSEVYSVNVSFNVPFQCAFK